MSRFASVAAIVVTSLACKVAPALAGTSPDPDAAKLVTRDIDLFWSVMDEATDENRAVLLQKEYVEGGSVGVHGFTPNRIISGEALAEMIEKRPDAYSPDARARMGRIKEQENQIRAAFHELKRLYPPAVFPDVYFVVGRLNSGGTSSNAGLLIGAEMYASSDDDLAKLPHIVAHEWAHYNQSYSEDGSLLMAVIAEGGADFIGELASGDHINQAAHEFGLAHEAELWALLDAAKDEPFGTEATQGWMYGGAPIEGGPNDLGYFMGYRICQAYYEQAEDKDAAIVEILTTRDVNAFLDASGYADRFAD